MFEQLQAPDNVIAIHISGKLTKDDMKGYGTILDDLLKNKEKVNVYCDYTGISDITEDALVQGAKLDMRFFSHINKLRRLAVVSDKEWMKAVADYMKPLLPTVEIKRFTPDQSEQAMQWASQMPKETAKTKKQAFEFIQTNRDDTIAFEIDGVVSSEEMTGITEKFNEFLNNHDKIRLLARVKHYGFDPAILTQKGLFSMKMKGLQKLERYAIVGGPGWIGKIVGSITGFFDNMEIRTFKAEDEADAWAWLEAKPAE